jgi:conjugal transfer/entry exclusion protein
MDISLLLSLSLVALPVTSRAQFGGEIVYDPSNFAKNTVTAAQSIQTVKQLLRMLEGAILTMPDERRVVAAINEALAIATAIHYRLPNPADSLRRRFPGYDYDLSRGAVWYDDEERAVRAVMNTLQAVLAATHEQLSAQQEREDIDTLHAISGITETTPGIRGVMQLGNQAAVFNGQQLLRLRQSLGALVNLQTVLASHELNQKAATEKAWRTAVAEEAAKPMPRGNSGSLFQRPRPLVR